jgi:nickel/cobalt exporter
MARLSLGHGSHTHDYDLQYTEHSHQHASARAGAMDLTSPDCQDPHELAHANDIRKRFADREVTTGQMSFLVLQAD